MNRSFQISTDLHVVFRSNEIMGLFYIDGSAFKT